MQDGLQFTLSPTPGSDFRYMPLVSGNKRQVLKQLSVSCLSVLLLLSLLPIHGPPRLLC